MMRRALKLRLEPRERRLQRQFLKARPHHRAVDRATAVRRRRLTIRLQKEAVFPGFFLGANGNSTSHPVFAFWGPRYATSFVGPQK